MLDPSFSDTPEILLANREVNIAVRNTVTDPEYLASRRSEIKQRHYSRALGLRAVHLINTKADPASGVAVIYPFGEGDTKSMRDTLCVIQDVLPGRPNVYGFPNNAVKVSYDNHHPSTDSIRAMRKGYFYPYAQNIMRYLEQEELEELQTVVGIQAGASIANVFDVVAEDRGVVKVRSKSLIEPANTIPRDKQQLIYALKTAAITNKRHIIKNFKTSRAIAEKLNIYKYDATSEAVLEGLERGTFAEDYSQANPSVPTVALRGLKSLVCPTFGVDNVRDNTILYAQRERGAEIAGDSFLIALVAEEAIRAARLS